MSLSSYALCSVEYAKAALNLSDAQLSRPFLTVYCTLASATTGTVAVRDGVLTLVVNSTTTNLTLSSYVGVTELVDAINDVTDWFASAVGPDGAPATDLFNVAAASCIGAANAVTLYGVDNYGLELLIEASTRSIERYCGRRFASRTYVELYNPNTREVMLNNLPVTDIVRVAVGRRAAIRVGSSSALHTSAYVSVLPSSAAGTDAPNASAGTLRIKASSTTSTFSLTGASYDTLTELVAGINATGLFTATLLYDGTDGGSHPSVDLIPCGARECRYPNTVDLQMVGAAAAEYEFDAAAGSLYIASAVNDYEDYGPQTVHAAGGPNSILVEYVAGYATVPASVQLACAEAVKLALDSAKVNGAMQSEKIGNYSYTLADVAANAASGVTFNARIDNLLAPWRLAAVA